MGNSCNHDLLHARGGEDLAKIWRVSVITVISSYLEFKGYSAVHVELFATDVDLSNTNQQRGRQTRPKHHTT